MTKGFYRILLLVMLGTLQACTSSELSPEDEIRQYIETGVEAAESRNAGDLAELIHDGYLGPKGYDKVQLEKIARLYFFRHKSIHLFTKINAIDFLSPDEAQVSMHVAMAGSVISDASVLSGLRARIYKFELTLVKEDSWLLQEASWSPASIGDMD